MKRKKNIAKAAAAAFIATSLTATVVPVYADDSTADDVTKDESVYTVLNADGSVSEITVSDILHSDDGFDNYADTSDLKDVENLKSNDPVKTTNGGYSWTTKNKDIYYQGTSTKDLPLDVNITYSLDGKDMSASDMLGKSGHVRIKINVKNKEQQNYTVNGKTYQLGTPFVTVAGAMLDQDKFSNVKINEGTVQSDSSHNIAAAVMVPGLREGMKDILDADTFKTLDSYLIDDVTIDADVKDFESPSIMLAAATNTDALKDEMKDAKLTDVFSQLDELQAATDKLVNGTQTLYDGADELNSGAGTLNNGVSTLQDGISKLSSGASTLYSGANQLSAGAASLQNGLGQLSANSASLRSGAAQVAQAVVNTVNQQLSEQGLSTVTLDNFLQVLNDNGYIHDTPQLEAAGRQGVKAEIQKTGATVSDSDVDTIVYYALTSPDVSGNSASEKIANAAKTLSDIQNGIAGNAAAAQQVVAGAASTDDLYNKALAVDGVKTLVNNQKKDAASDDKANAYALNAFNTAVTSATDGAAKAGAKLEETIAKGIVVSALSEAQQKGTISDTNALTQSITAKVTDYLTNGAKAQAGDQIAAATFDAYNKGYTQAAANEAAVESAIAGLYKQQVMATSDTDVLKQIVQGVKDSGAGSDAEAMTVIVYAGETGKDLNTAGSDLKKAQSAQSAQTNAAADVANSSGSIVLGTYYQLAAPSATDAVKGANNSNSALASLVSIKAFVQGVNQYTAGVDSAYAGSKTLASGASQVASGASQLKDGINQLSSGAATLKSGSDALANGTSQLKSGAKTLLDGMKQYNDEGISKLTKNDKISDLKDAADLLDQVRKDGKNYDNYSGISDGTDGTVKFVYKVEGVKETEKNSASDSEKKDNRTFFQRVADLFKFSK